MQLYVWFLIQDVCYTQLSIETESDWLHHNNFHFNFNFKHSIASRQLGDLIAMQVKPRYENTLVCSTFC